jgi:hypothetical protein
MVLIHLFAVSHTDNIRSLCLAILFDALFDLNWKKREPRSPRDGDLCPTSTTYYRRPLSEGDSLAFWSFFPLIQNEIWEIARSASECFSFLSHQAFITQTWIHLFFVITYCRYMLHSSRFFGEFLSSLVLWLVRTYGKWKCWTAPSAQSRYTGWRMFLLTIYSISEMDCYLFCELITFKYIKFVLETNERDEENVFTETRRTNHLYSIFTG